MMMMIVMTTTTAIIKYLCLYWCKMQHRMLCSRVYILIFSIYFPPPQNYLRVAFQEINSGCTGKTLLVRPYITTEDVCQLCAEKFKVDNPENFSLFLFIDDTWQQLTEDTYPQKIKAELHSRPQPQVFHFVYKRINSDPYGAIFQNDNRDQNT
uniref:Ras-associating domain-containing protein n=2 Tax=Micrurus TaxID=8634 RepID=A0A2D4HG31_MICLE